MAYFSATSARSMTPTKITLSQLESFLFKSADILRDQPDLLKELLEDKAT
jgi:hypothetical protein